MKEDMAQHHATAEGGPQLLPISKGTTRLSHTVPRLLVEDHITLPFVKLTWRQSGLLLLGFSFAFSWWQALSWLGGNLFGVIARLAIAGVPLLVAVLAGWLHPLGRPLEQWLLVLWRFWKQPPCLAWSPHPQWVEVTEGLLSLESAQDSPSESVRLTMPGSTPSQSSGESSGGSGTSTTTARSNWLSR